MHDMLKTPAESLLELAKLTWLSTKGATIEGTDPVYPLLEKFPMRHRFLAVVIANRDPARYSDPDRLDIRRDEGASISFASGIHSCIGAVMARMEAQIAIGGFARRFPTARLVDENPETDLRALPLTRGYRQIRVRV